jgi:formylglycine-generating enzyme required for sulfatase activity
MSGTINQFSPTRAAITTGGREKAIPCHYLKILSAVLFLSILSFPAPSEVLAAEASSQDKTWTNSLGMVFVPVPGTEVWFCIWETRIQDYEVFSKAGEAWAPSDLKKPKFEQGPTHPVVNVSWEDARVFGLWLTAKEQKAGLLKDNEAYRLPTDLEWSRAVGLPNEKGSTAQKRDGQTPGYPWGSVFPPPKDVGNYAPAARVDTYKFTAPVGSFRPNALGIYDLGGNVWEWCVDMDDGRNRHVLRGASWYDGGGPGYLIMSSRRDYTTPDGDIGNYGFRCVLIKAR